MDTKDRYDILEVRPKKDGRYIVTLYSESTGEYWYSDLDFIDGCWNYEEPSLDTYVCFIHARRTNEY